MMSPTRKHKVHPWHRPMQKAQKHFMYIMVGLLISCGGNNATHNPVQDPGNITAPTPDPGSAQASVEPDVPNEEDASKEMDTPISVDNSTTPQPDIPSEADVPSSPLRYLALGDSYTIGQNVPPEERWPVQLAEMLEVEGLSMEAPEIIAQTGWTTGNLKQAIANQDPQGSYDLVTLLIGVNNQYQGRSLEEFRSELKELLVLSLAFAGGAKEHLIVVTIPDYGITPFAANSDKEKIASDLAQFNQIVIEEAALIEAPLVDIRELWLQAANDASLIADDGLHPSGSMYTLWAQAVLPKAMAALK